MKLDISDENQQQQQNQIASKCYYKQIYKKHLNFLFTKTFTQLKSKEVKRQYPKLLGLVFDYIMDNDSSINFSSLLLEEKAETFSKIALLKSEYIQSKIISFIIFYQKDKIEKKEIASGTLRNYIKVIKFFCEMSNILNINQKLIYRGLPTSVQAAYDRIPTIDEIKRLLEFHDRRIKPAVLLMLSSGIRLGA